MRNGNGMEGREVHRSRLTSWAIAIDLTAEQTDGHSFWQVGSDGGEIWT